VQLNSKQRADDRRAVYHDRRRRGRFQSEGWGEISLHDTAQSFIFPKNALGAIKSPSKRGGERSRRSSPRRGFEVAEDAIGDAEGGFQTRVSLVVRGPHDRISVGDDLEHCLVEFMTAAFTLDCEVEGGLSAEVSLVPQLGDRHETSDRTIETLEDRVVKPF